MRAAGVRDPRQLPVGRPLTIPRAWLRWLPDGTRLASVRGTVQILMRGQKIAPIAGTVLREGTEITTAADSFATLVLSNGSRVALPSQSRVSLVHMRKFVIDGAIDYRFTLNRGRVDARVTPLKDPSGRFNITTPLAMTAVRGTEFAVAYDGERQSMGTEVLAGTVAVSKQDGTLPLIVPKEFGATTDTTGQSKKVKLLAAPDLQDAGRVQVDDLVTFALTPVAGAVGYRIMLATDAGFVDTYREEVSASPHFAIRDVPNGNQFVRIAALADNGLAGLRQSYSFTRRLASIHAEAGATPDGYRFKWFGAGEGERHYRLQIFRNRLESTPIVDEVGLTRSEVTVQGLSAGTYFWRVAVIQISPEGDLENWTEPERLTIAGSGG